MKYVSWLVFGCSLALLLLANFATYSIQGYDCRGLPFVYERSRTWISVLGLGLNDYFHPLTLAIDIAIAIVVSGVIGLFAARFSSMRHGPRAIFVLAVLAFAAANVHLIHYGSPTPDAISDSTLRHFFAPYRYYVMLVPSLALAVTGFIWSLTSARRRCPESPTVAR